MNRTVVRNVAIIADYKVFIGCEHDFTLRRWTSGNVRIRLIQSSAVHHDATGPDGDSFARQTDHPFQQHEPAFIELEGDHIAAFRSVPAESEAVNEIDPAVVIGGHHAVADDANRKKQKLEQDKADEDEHNQPRQGPRRSSANEHSSPPGSHFQRWVLVGLSLHGSYLNTSLTMDCGKSMSIEPERFGPAVPATGWPGLKMAMRNHVNCILGKLRVNDRTQAATMALRRGIAMLD